MWRACCSVVLIALLYAPGTGAFTPPDGVDELDASDAAITNYEVLLSAAEKVGRELHFSESRRVSGQSARRIWRLPVGAQLDDVYEAVSEQLAGDVLYSCAGRRCGRSNAWANIVFKDALLYGQDRYQRYRVVQTSPTELQLVYAVQRGNRRIHLLLETITTVDADLADTALVPTSPVQLAAVRRDLTNGGLIRLRVEPDPGGELGPGALDGLAATGGALAGLKIAELYVVCHLYGAESAERLLTASTECATTAAGALQDGHAAALGEAVAADSANRARPAPITFVPFGAGPLLPRLPLDNATTELADAPANRLELVAPALLWR